MFARGRGHDADRAADRHGRDVDRHRGACRRLQLGHPRRQHVRVQASTAGTLADKQMELYRQAAFASLPLGAADADDAHRRRTAALTGCRSEGAWTCAVGTYSAGPPAELLRHTRKPSGQAPDDHGPRRARRPRKSSSPRTRPSTPRQADNPLHLRNPDGCIRIRRNQRPGARELRRHPRAGREHCARATADARAPAALAGRAQRRRRARAHQRVQEGEAEGAAGLRAPVRDDDRGRRQRRPGARDARGADRRQVPRRGDRRRPLRRRGRRHPLEGAGAASEGVQPPLRRDGRGRRVVGNARHRARPRGGADREGDADQAARQGSDGLSHRRHLVRIPRAHVHAPVHHPRLREGLRLAGRRAAEAHAARDERLVRAPALLVHHLPGDRGDDLRLPPPQAHRARDGRSGIASSSRSR